MFANNGPHLGDVKLHKFVDFGLPRLFDWFVARVVWQQVLERVFTFLCCELKRARWRAERC